jgi:hypothetical protein
MVFVVLLAFSSDARATLYVATQRPLTRAELVGTTVHEADQVVVGELIRKRLTAVDLVSGRPSHLTFQVRRTLKGTATPGDLQVCRWPSESGDVVDQDARLSDGRSFVVFIRHADHPAARSDSCQWMVIEEGPPWLLPAISRWSPPLEEEVRRAIASQRPEALAAAAERIVLGTIHTRFSKKLPWSTFVQVSQSFKGSRAAKRLPIRVVDTRVGFPKGPLLLFLRRASDGVYEPVQLIAGVRVVKDGRIPSWDLSLESVARMVARQR